MTHESLTPAQQADALWKATQKLKLALAKLEPLKAEIAALETELLRSMLVSKTESLGTKNTTVAIKRTTFGDLKDDRAFFAYVAREGAWDLVRKQVNTGAAKERWEAGIEIPGVERATRVDLSITTRKK